MVTPLMSLTNRFPRSLRRISSVGLLAAVVCLVAAVGASAHATLNLYGKYAVANKKGNLTVTIPHGCMPDDASTTRIVVKLGGAWQAAKPRAVTGWTSVVDRTSSGGWRITWTATGAGLPYATSGDFPIRVRWPKKAGIYDTPTLQYCGSQLLAWKDPFHPAADGDIPYPANYPVPRVKVHANSKNSPTAVTGATPMRICPLAERAAR